MVCSCLLPCLIPLYGLQVSETLPWFSFSLCIISLNMTFWSCIKVAENCKCSSFLRAESYSIVYICHNLLIHSSVIGHVGSFHSLFIAGSTTMNMGVHLSFCVWGVDTKKQNQQVIWKLYYFLRNFQTVFHQGWSRQHSHPLNENFLFVLFW